MNSRERVRAMLAGEKTDRLVNGLGGCETAGMHIKAYSRLQQLYGDTAVPRLDTFMCNAVFEIPMVQALRGDILLLASPKMCRADFRGTDNEKQWKSARLLGMEMQVPACEVFETDSAGTTHWRTLLDFYSPKGSDYFDDPKVYSYTDDLVKEDVEKFNPPDSYSDDFLRRLEETARQLYNSTDFSLCLGESITDLQVSPGGMVNTLMLLLEEPQMMHGLLEKCVQAGLKQISLLDQAVGKYVDILSIAHDFGDNRGLLMGAPVWREIYLPHYKQLFQGWHQRTKMKINLHSCGGIGEILPDLAGCGVDILNPVQLSAAHMDIASLKASGIVLWGGAYDAQKMHGCTQYQTVYEHVCGNIRALSAGGGYIFAGVHNLPADMPPLHMRAMLDAFADCAPQR